jgi:hypothetical protein
VDILNSEWLIKMLEKSSPQPHVRLLSLFDILEDWLEAPSVAEQVKRGLPVNVQAHLLQDFLALEAAKAGVAMPEMLANQLYFMAIAAAQEKLQGLSDLDCNHTSLNHAKSAAHALIIAQTKKEFHIAKLSAYAIAASFLAICVISGGLLMSNLNQQTKAKLAANQQIPIRAAIPQLVSADNLADPEQTAALMAQIELMRHGNCQLIEAIQLPDQYKGIYLNMVVNGQVSTDPREQKIAFALLKQTRCNYTPMLMANSK